MRYIRKYLLPGVCVQSLFSCVWLCATQWTVIHQASLSMGFPRWEYWSGLSCPSPMDLPDLGIEPTSLMSPALVGRFFTTSTTWEALAPGEHSVSMIIGAGSLSSKGDLLPDSPVPPLLLLILGASYSESQALTFARSHFSCHCTCHSSSWNDLDPLLSPANSLIIAQDLASVLSLFLQSPLTWAGHPMSIYEMCMLSHVRLFAAPWTIACQAPLSLGFPRQEYWSELMRCSQVYFNYLSMLLCPMPRSPPQGQGTCPIFCHISRAQPSVVHHRSSIIICWTTAFVIRSLREGRAH